MKFYTKAEINEAVMRHSDIYAVTGCNSVARLTKDNDGNVVEFHVGLVGNLGHELKGCSMCYGPRDDN